MYLPCLADLNHELGTDHTDRLSEVCLPFRAEWERLSPFVFFFFFLTFLCTWCGDHEGNLGCEWTRRIIGL